jgi:hypothetical protein
MSHVYQRKTRNLPSALQDPAVKTEALRRISAIKMLPDERAPNRHHIELAGELTGILALEMQNRQNPPEGRGLVFARVL